MTGHTEPNPGALRVLAGLPDDGPVVMLNMLRFRTEALYPEGSGHAPCSGREAYRRYGKVAFEHVQAVGGSLVWSGAAQQALIGPADEAWDEILLVQYPSRAQFLVMVSNPEYLACAVHRTAALADSRLIAMQPAR